MTGFFVGAEDGDALVGGFRVGCEVVELGLGVGFGCLVGFKVGWGVELANSETFCAVDGATLR